MIGIIGAMASEVDALIAELSEAKSERISGSLFTTGRLAGEEVVIVRSGIGKVAAATAAEAMILRYAPTLLVNTGVGGSLSENLSVTDIAIADRAVEHDMDTTPLGDPPLFLGFLKGVSFFWTTVHLFCKTVLLSVILLGIFFLLDTFLFSKEG